MNLVRICFLMVGSHAVHRRRENIPNYLFTLSRSIWYDSWKLLHEIHGEELGRPTQSPPTMLSGHLLLPTITSSPFKHHPHMHLSRHFITTTAACKCTCGSIFLGLSVTYCKFVIPKDSHMAWLYDTATSIFGGKYKIYF